MSGEVADFAAALPPRFRYSVMSAFRQVLKAAVKWGHIASNPAELCGPNPQPPARAIRVYSPAELAALDRELGPTLGPIVPFAAATGLRPSEWAGLQRSDVDRRRRLVRVGVRTTEGSRKTDGSFREVPLAAAAVDALDRVAARLDTPYVFASPTGLPLHLNNFRRRDWRPAVKTAGVEKPARLYDLRSTFASNALDRGLTVYELAKVMGTSVAMIEKHYGRLVDGAAQGILDRLDRADEAAEPGRSRR
jgi:integrase